MVFPQKTYLTINIINYFQHYLAKYILFCKIVCQNSAAVISDGYLEPPHKFLDFGGIKPL